MSTINFYIIVTAAFVQIMSGRQSSVNKGNYFGYAVTKDSTFVVSINTVNDFPQALDSFADAQPGGRLVVKALGIEDFPQTPPIK